MVRGFALVAVLSIAMVANWVSPARGQEKNPVVVVDTSMGKFKIELYQDKAPITVKNFLQYVDDKHYDGTLFHRVIKGFMIQGGGLDMQMTQKPTRGGIQNESTNGLANKRGTVAMARTGQPNSATSQFFVNVVDNAFLDKANAQDRVGYCVFGQVVDGMDVVDKIRAVATKAGDVPVTPVVITSVKRADKK